ncbi:MAG: sigma 54-interacting transcriptional regulator [Nitrospirae bacterium]|nr:sigma 54-interacting transcriptional regulator [Nitrospirota bacterium]
MAEQRSHDLRRWQGQSYLAQLEILYEISKTFRQNLKPQEQIRRGLHVLSEMLHLKRAIFVVEDGRSGLLRITEGYGLSPEERQRASFKSGEGLIGQAFKNGSPIVASLADSSREPLPWDHAQSWSGERKWGFLAVPIRTTERVCGVLALEYEASEGLPTQELTRLIYSVCNFWSKLLTPTPPESMPAKSSIAPKGKRHAMERLVGESRAMHKIVELIATVSHAKTPILLRGESGTGKGLAAETIHQSSRYSRGPFVKVVCASIPEALFESELFGYHKGAFTGALRDKPGLVETASGGSLFLDEIGDIPLPVQVKLLRFLQEKTFERLGGTRPLRVDTRVIAATNQSLEDLVRRGLLREDLYYRLNVLPITLPPLRERVEDIPILAAFFLDAANREHAKDVSLTAEAIQMLREYSWPGNIRELENFVERLVVLSPGGAVRPENIVLHGLDPHQTPRPATALSTEPSPPSLGTLRDLEREKIVEALRQADGVQEKAARLLGITRRQIGHRIKKFGIRRDPTPFQ